MKCNKRFFRTDESRQSSELATVAISSELAIYHTYTILTTCKQVILYKIADYTP